MLVGNKIDLVTSNPEKREVSTEQGENFAKQEGLLFIETSAVASVKVKEAFESLLEEIYKNSRSKNNKKAPDHGDNLNPMAEQPKESPCCG